MAGKLLILLLILTSNAQSQDTSRIDLSRENLGFVSYPSAYSEQRMLPIRGYFDIYRADTSFKVRLFKTLVPNKRKYPIVDFDSLINSSRKKIY